MNPELKTIVGFREGNVLAFRKIYEQYSSVLLFFVFSLIKDKTEAEDIVTDVFVKLWKLRDNFETETNIKAFLYITARNTSLNYIKYRNRETARLKELSLLTAHTEETIYFEITAEILELISKVIKQLPEKQREIIHLILFEGLSDQEVAQRLDKAVKTVYNQKNSAIQTIHQQIRKGGLVIVFIISISPLDDRFL